MKRGASVVEVNFDCLVGPTHHFGGLSLGNLASTKNKARAANPKRAALQGLKKMQYLMERGFVQAVLPPHERPHLPSFRNLGFDGAPEKILKDAYDLMPHVFSSLCSSSAMWAANAATVSPSADSVDHKVHLSPSNLVTMFHRSIEHEFTARVFRIIFADANQFVVHDALLPHDLFSDEGAANHNRLCPHHGDTGLQVFVYGKENYSSSQKSSVFPSRQSSHANLALARRHKIRENYWINIEQNHVAIDKGAFHNDVVAVTNEHVLLCHELAFADQKKILATIERCYGELFHQPLTIIEVQQESLSIDDAVSSYFFNSQLLTKPDGAMLLFAPADCEQNVHAKSALRRIVEENNPIDEVVYFDISESMANGGGPACLRLRVPLSERELASINDAVVLTPDLTQELERIIETHYVDELKLEHFFDPRFLDQANNALDQISRVLKMGSIYDFQR